MTSKQDFVYLKFLINPVICESASCRDSFFFFFFFFFGGGGGVGMALLKQVGWG